MASSFDMTRLRAATKQLGPLLRKSNKEMMTRAAKGFVGDIIKLTPPGSSKAQGAAAKKAGEATIAADVLRLAQPVLAVGRNAKAALTTESDLLAAHKAARVNSSGRVNLRSRKEKLFVAQAIVLRVIARLQKQVGYLAGSLVKAAAHLGVSVAAWIKRHATAPGSYTQTERRGGFRIELSNDVDFVGKVKGFDARWQKVLDYQAKKMEREADHLMKENLRQAGWH